MDVKKKEKASKGCCWFCHLGIKIKFLVGDRKEVKILEISSMWVMKNLIKRIFQISAIDWSYVTYKMLTLLKIFAAKYYQKRHNVNSLKIPYFSWTLISYLFFFKHFYYSLTPPGNFSYLTSSLVTKFTVYGFFFTTSCW